MIIFLLGPKNLPKYLRTKFPVETGHQARRAVVRVSRRLRRSHPLPPRPAETRNRQALKMVSHIL